jgi:hypothetical protein
MQVLSNTTGGDVLLTEAQAADILNLSVRTLQAWRVRGDGPAVVHAGRAVRYRHRDLFAWVDQNTCRTHREPTPTAA